MFFICGQKLEYMEKTQYARREHANSSISTNYYSTQHITRSDKTLLIPQEIIVKICEDDKITFVHFFLNNKLILETFCLG